MVVLTLRASLFTNMPVEETKKFVSQLSQNTDVVQNLNRVQFESLYRLAAYDSDFMFNGKPFA